MVTKTKSETKTVLGVISGVEEEIVETTKDDTEKKIKVGTSLIKNLSISFYPNTAMIFDELVTNSRDAMASNVIIHLGSDIITIEDDGEGMTPQELKKFFYISHSDKPLVTMKSKKDMKRQIIGRFGIGKLSLYQLCKSFTIETWKNKTISRASFNFEEFEKKKFIDEFDLQVDAETINKKSGGTKITLSNLHHDKIPKLKEIIDRLEWSMPLRKDFKVSITTYRSPAPYVLKTSDKPIGSMHKIDTDKDEWSGFDHKPPGRITGTIIYKPTEKRESGRYGVYVRVLGRLVNADDPYSLINFSGLTHARQFARKIYADLDVDCLADALLTNRSGFIIDDKKVIQFRDWLKDLLNHLNDEEYKEWKKTHLAEEKDEIRTMVAAIVEDMLKEPNMPATINKYSGMTIDLRHKPRTSEPAIWQGKKSIIINSAHPLYHSAQQKGKIWGVRFYSTIIIIIEIAMRESKNMKEFKALLYSMMGGQPVDYRHEEEE